MISLCVFITVKDKRCLKLPVRPLGATEQRIFFALFFHPDAHLDKTNKQKKVVKKSCKLKPCLSALLLDRLSRSSSTVWFPLFFLSPRAVCLDRCHLSVLLLQSALRGTGWVLKAKCLAVTAASDARVPAA